MGRGVTSERKHVVKGPYIKGVKIESKAKVLDTVVETLIFNISGITKADTKKKKEESDTPNLARWTCSRQQSHTQNACISKPFKFPRQAWICHRRGASASSSVGSEGTSTTTLRKKACGQRKTRQNLNTGKRTLVSLSRIYTMLGPRDPATNNEGITTARGSRPSNRTPRDQVGVNLGWISSPA